MLVEGAIAPGSKLNERALSELLNVSRTPLREAIKMLAAEGLVELLPNRGAIARFLTNPVLMWFGVISYGIALWHVVIMADLGLDGNAGFLQTFLIGSAITIPLAAISYYLVERPLMKFKYRSPRDVFRGWRESRKDRGPVADTGGPA